MLTKREKARLEKLEDRLYALEAKLEKQENLASETMRNISDPPEEDDWMEVESLLFICKEIRDLHEQIFLLEENEIGPLYRKDRGEK